MLVTQRTTRRDRGERSSSMDSAHAIEVLKQGPQAWNAWRAQHPELRPQLGDEDLSTVPLREAALHDLDLTHVHGLVVDQLGGANLANAQLPPTLPLAERLADVDMVAQNGQKL